MSDKELRRIFRFDETDLAANRDGELSPRQVERLKKKSRADRKTSLVVGLFLAAVSVLPIGILWISGAPWFMFIIWCVIWVPLWGFASVSILKGAIVPAESPIVRVVEGPAELSTRGARGRPGSAFILKVGEKKFENGSDLSEAIKEGEALTVYYSEGADEILSVERSE